MSDHDFVSDRVRPAITIVVLLLAALTTAITFADDTPNPPPNESTADLPSTGLDLYGDPLPAGAIARLGTIRYRHPGWYKRFAFLSDNETFLVGTGGPDGLLRAWNARSGVQAAEFDLAGGELVAYCLSLDGKSLATLSRRLLIETREAELHLTFWRAPLWRERGRIIWKERPGPATPTRIAFSADAAHLLGGTQGGNLRVWEVDSGRQVVSLHLLRDSVDALACSPGDLVAIAGRQGAVVWKLLSEEAPRPISGLPQGAQAVQFSHDGALLAVGGYDELPARVYQVEPWQELAALKGKSPRYYREGLCFTPDDRQLMVPSNAAHAVEVFDVRSGKLLRTLHAGRVEARDVAISPDGRLIVSGGSPAAVVVWDAQTGERLSDQVVGHEESPFEVLFMPDGHQIATGATDGTVRLWDAATGKQLRLMAHDHWVAGLAHAPNGAQLASWGFDGTVRLWETATGKQHFQVPGHGRTGGNNTVELAFSPDGERVLTFGADLLLRISSTSTGKVLVEHAIRPAVANTPAGNDALPVDDDPFGPAGDDPFGDDAGGFSVEQARVTPDARKLLISSRQTGLIHIFDVESGRAVNVIHPQDSLQDFAVSPNGKRLCTFEQPPLVANNLEASRHRSFTLRLCDLVTQQVVSEVTLPGAYARQIAFSPTGDRLAFPVSTVADPATNVRERWITVLAVPTLREKARIKCPSNRPTHLAFSPDGIRLAGSQEDTSVLVWDLSEFGVALKSAP